MITSQITNITLDSNRIKVFLQLSNGIIESNLFSEDATSETILGWQQTRESYWNNLENKVLELKTILIDNSNGSNS